jgi:hypothetical protein
MSKVAPTSGVWNLGIVVHDRLQNEINETRTNIQVVSTETADAAYANQWYGEVAIINGSSINFTDAPAGSGFLLSSPAGSSGVWLRFISNGLFQQQVQTGTTWDPVETGDFTPEFAYLIPNSGITDEDGYVILRTEGNRFALTARRTTLNESSNETSFVEILPDGITSNLLVPPKNDNTAYNLTRGEAKPSLISAMADGLAATDEFGITSRFEFGIRVSRVFETGVYNGTISIGISNTPGTFGSNN